MLNQIPDLVRGLPQADADGVLALGEPRLVPGGAILFPLGADADALYVIDRGVIALRLPMEVGGHPHEVVVEERGVGQTVGWSALIPPHRFTLEAVAIVDSTVVVLPGAALRSHLQSRPDVGFAVMQNLAATVGQRLQVIQAMWLREMQRVVQLRYA